MSTSPALGAVPPAGAHGGDGAAVARALGLAPEDLLDLSQTMNPLAPPVERVVERHLGELHRYPDRTAATRELASALGVDLSHVLLTNGGSEAIALVAAELGGGVRDEPEFGLHPRSPDGPRWRSDPHNPTGRLAAPSERADVWDEAFYPLATGRWTAGRGQITVGSLTKTFACPGLRLGYVLADPDLVARLDARQPHWPVSSLALAALPDLLAAADLQGWARGIRELRSELTTLLRGHGLEVEDTDSSWVLVHRAGLRERLAPQGVLVRDCASFGMPGTARVAVTDERGLARLEAALRVTPDR
ncbi:aminotransferase class I/II-fold pyridoxal phosphate-dependent enzyme [Serinicoccus kebangsaanensis]|uniref:aminotransferase class I/II-fold pyridoxal phosphate-dependent enzyme n=1 Tax=Serinicoccus kebangsaanensis TaxID=2602069 RepID=UPI00124E2179|nr:aminotransferase class I/II-fold pyridoxal phosphate-dependent enzyme [Serinicoccus kebangsaanensis]